MNCGEFDSSMSFSLLSEFQREIFVLFYITYLMGHVKKLGANPIVL